MAEHTGSKIGNMLFLVTAVVAVAMIRPLTFQGQSQPPRLSFEVVSVKVNKPGQRRELAIQYLPGGRFSARAVPIPLLVVEAYDTPRLYPSPEFQKLDVSVIERDLYDIEAVAPKEAIPAGSSAKVRNDKIREMLQTLLMDRFKLRVHREMKEQQAYAIVVAKNGPRFQSGAVDECADRPTNFFDPGSCHSIADLVKFAQRTGRLELPIVDKTGLTGLYNIQNTDWTAIISGPGQAKVPDDSNLSRPTIYDLLDKLGLKLDMQKATVDMLVVDHVERPTLEN